MDSGTGMGCWMTCQQESRVIRSDRAQGVTIDRKFPNEKPFRTAQFNNIFVISEFN